MSNLTLQPGWITSEKADPATPDYYRLLDEDGLPIGEAELSRISGETAKQFQKRAMEFASDYLNTVNGN
jgi:hypothetical protein